MLEMQEPGRDWGLVISPRTSRIVKSRTARPTPDLTRHKRRGLAFLRSRASRRCPMDGAEDFGRDLSVPYRIVAFVTWADGAPVISPLVDVTDKFSGASASYGRSSRAGPSLDEARRAS